MRLKVPRQYLFIATLPIALCTFSASANCTLSTQGVSFGNYNILSPNPTDSTGLIEVTCTPQAAYTISLSPGSSGTYTERTMLNGQHSLSYNLYTTATHSFIWGDGSGNSTTVSGLAANTQTQDIYGRIPPGQDVAVGSYGDTITITIEF